MFFAAIWGGMLADIRKVTSSTQSYVWLDSLYRARTKVAWIQYYQRREKGGINMTNPKDALIALMSKWVLKVCEPGASNLHVFLRFM